MGGGPQPTIPTTTTRAATPVPPLSGGTLLALADGTTVAASDPERDQVYLVDTIAGTVRARVALQAGRRAGALVQDAARAASTSSCAAAAPIATIDPATGDGQRATGGLHGAARDRVSGSDSDQIHVACAGGELVSLPAAGGTRRAR